MRALVALITTVLLALTAIVPAAATAPARLAAGVAAGHPPGTYQPLNPTRIFDTRPSHPIAARATARMPILGVAGLPASGISAVTVTLSLPTPATSGSVSVFPSGVTWPGPATVTFAAGSTQQNTVTAQLGTDGAISVRNNAASAVQLVADVVGYYTTGPAVPGGYRPVPLQRLFDTRAAGSHPLAAGAVANVAVAGRGAVPASNVSTGMVNLTVLSPVATGSVSVFPAGTAWDHSTTASFATGRTEQSMLTAQLGGNGAFSVRNNTGVALQLVIDLVGYYVAGSPLAPGGYQPMARDRIFDTRIVEDEGPEPLATTIGDAQVATLGINIASPYTGPKTPHWGLRAETILFTVVSPSQSGSISVYAGDRRFDGKAMVSFSAGRTVQRLVTVRVPPEGSIRIRINNPGASAVIADIVGYFAGPRNRLHLTGSAQLTPDRDVADISCTSASFCMAVTHTGHAYRYDGTTWSSAFDSKAAINAVSCASPTFCVGVGGWGGTASTYDGTSWSAPVVVDSGETLVSVSCASASFCVTMGTHDGKAFVFDGTGWDTGTLLGPQANGSSVSCPTSTFCLAAVGGWFQWDGSHWSGEPDPADPSPVQVSCASPTFCQYVTYHFSGYIWADSWWQDGTRAPLNHFQSSISCPAAYACLIGDESEVSVWDGTEWSMPVLVSRRPGTIGFRLSCPTPDFCMAVDGSTSYRLDS